MSLSTRFRATVGILSLCTLAAHAQTEAPATPLAPAPPVATTPAVEPLLMPAQVKGKYKDYLNKRYASDKEARAAVHMFGRKQTGGAVWLVGGGAVLGLLSAQTGTTRTNTGTTTFTISPLGYVVFAGLPTALAISKFTRFSNGELYKMLLEYDKSHSLPGYVIGKLSKSDYQ
ncbi:hypothetical protein ACFP2F_04905 [Hymenobacter artigasi]|uniref:Uncharacterized protein n=1 Tax=Hymenobacter artigasi TaxID=2719616 RepID=A0ABX1HGG7_9BACT|nr:hypothetical protein [Hymenobacter artigasi]NKI88949.1 hypothetical protein [Hymenobacter artigasi]